MGELHAKKSVIYLNTSLLMKKPGHHLIYLLNRSLKHKLCLLSLKQVELPSIKCFVWVAQMVCVLCVIVCNTVDVNKIIMISSYQYVKVTRGLK